MFDTLEIEGGDRYIMATPAVMIPEDRETDFAGAKELAVPRHDIGYVMGRYVQLDPGDGSAANSNGHIFPAVDVKDRGAYKLVVGTPTNILHRRQHVVGSFLGADIFDPKAMTAKALPDDQMPFPFVETLSGIWRYHFPEEYAAIRKSHDAGQLWLSMEAVADSLTCKTEGVHPIGDGAVALAAKLGTTVDGVCNGATYPYKGIRDDSYCVALNASRSRKVLNKPHFVGGAVIFPPAAPGWRRADITEVASVIEAHPEEAEETYNKVAAMAAHLDPVEWEIMMAYILAGAFGVDAARPTLESFDIEAMLQRLADDAPVIDPGLDPDDADEFTRVPQDLAGYRPATDPEVNCGGCAHFDTESNTCALVAGTIDPTYVCDLWDAKIETLGAAEEVAIIAAGLAVLAADSGRVLMLQRAVDETDPASGMWEFPGGCLEPDEDPLAAAKREWAEEVGQAVPAGDVISNWISCGVYEGFVYMIPAEADVTINSDERKVLNPDDPDGDAVEVIAWFSPQHLPEMPALREECRTGTDWNLFSRLPEMAAAATICAGRIIDRSVTV